LNLRGRDFEGGDNDLRRVVGFKESREVFDGAEDRVAVDYFSAIFCSSIYNGK
jgi:hypothetical protein